MYYSVNNIPHLRMLAGYEKLSWLITHAKSARRLRSAPSFAANGCRFGRASLFSPLRRWSCSILRPKSFSTPQCGIHAPTQWQQQHQQQSSKHRQSSRQRQKQQQQQRQQSWAASDILNTAVASTSVSSRESKAQNVEATIGRGSQEADFGARHRGGWQRNRSEEELQSPLALHPGQGSQCVHTARLLFCVGQHCQGQHGRTLDTHTAALLWEGSQGEPVLPPLFPCPCPNFIDYFGWSTLLFQGKKT